MICDGVGKCCIEDRELAIGTWTDDLMKAAKRD